MLKSENHTKNRYETKILPGPEGVLNLGQGASIIYWKSFFTEKNNESYFQTLKHEINWVQKKIKIYGQERDQPRLISYMADNKNLIYTYSGLTLYPSTYTSTVFEIKNKIEDALNEEFNCVLLNYYRDGYDHMGWHSDNEKLFGTCPIIASVSYGVRRDFDIRNNIKTKKFRYHLGEGDVLIMKGTMQKYWMHQIPRRTIINKERINLTFRNIVYPETLNGNITY